MTSNGMKLVLMAALSTSACVMPGDDPERIDTEMLESSLDGDSIDIEGAGATAGADNQILAVPRLRTHKEIHYGGTLFEEDHYQNVGGLCSAGYVRVDPPTVSWAGNGHCNFDRWVNPDNPRDCTARIHLHHSAGWLYGDCYIDIFETRLTATCDGRFTDYCGGPGNDGTCYCDPACLTYGDCCFDYEDICL
jgi:hypothetical protein